MSESKSNTMYYIHCAIGCILMFLFRFLPAPAPITSLGMQMIGIFIGLIYMWSFVDTLWPSVMGLFALCLSDYGTTTSIIASSFGNSTSALMLLFLALVAVIEECDLAGYLSNRFLSIKKFAGRPWLFTLCWLIVVAAMSSCCNMFLIAFTFWAVFYKICDQTGIQKGEALCQPDDHRYAGLCCDRLDHHAVQRHCLDRQCCLCQYGPSRRRLSVLHSDGRHHDLGYDHRLCRHHALHFQSRRLQTGAIWI